MKKIIGCALIAGLALGCSHAPNKNALITETPSNVVYIKKGDREPAGAPELAWRPGTVSMNVTSQSGTASGKVEVNQEMTWMEEVEFQDSRNEYREVEVPGLCSDFVCTAGSSKSVLWDNYFSATKERKSAALANAIQGIGEASANALVAKRFFSSKPSSWQAFAAEINRAAQGGVIQKSVATGVLTTYKYENIANLGYARESCREVVSNCTVVISKLVSVPVLTKRNVPRSKVVATKSFNINVQVTGAVLMANETDKVNLRISENGTLLNIDASGYNRYSLVSQSFANNTISIVLKSDSRIMRDLPDGVKRQSSYQIVGGVATFILDIDPQYLPTSEDPNSQLVVDYQVHVCKYSGWLIDTCSSDWETQAISSASITSSRTIIPLNIPSQNKSEIVFTVVRRNSAFFNDRGVSGKSEKIKMPK